MTRPSGEIFSSRSMSRSMNVRSLTSSTAPMRLEFVSSGQKTRNASGLRVYMSRIRAPIARGLSIRAVAGLTTSMA